MVDDILLSIFGEALFERVGRWRWVALIVRLLAGLLGTGLCLVGAYRLGFESAYSQNLILRGAIVLLFGSFGSLWLFNVCLLHKWRWPLQWCVVSFALMFLARLLLGP
jgi:hypothetical protein